MPGVHVRLDLEHEAAEAWLARLHAALAADARLWCRRVADERAQQLLDAEVADRRTEQHRRLASGAIALRIETGGRAAHQLDLGGQPVGVGAEQLARRARSKPVDHAIAADTAALAGLVDVN